MKPLHLSMLVLLWSPLAQADIIFEDTGPEPELPADDTDETIEEASTGGCNTLGFGPTALISLGLAGLLLRKHPRA